MSYEPTLLIKVEGLEKHKKLFNKGYFDDENTKGGESNQTIMEYLSEVYHEEDKWIVDVFGIKCRYTTPHFSSYNGEIRKKLDELKIDYVCIGG